VKARLFQSLFYHHRAGIMAPQLGFDGRSGDIDLLLWPVNFTLAYVGYSVLRPFVAYRVEAGLRYSDASVVEARLKRVEDDLLVRIGRFGYECVNFASGPLV